MAVKRDDFKLEIINELGVISEGSKGWRKELNRVSWDGGEPKYDIRSWDEKHENKGKGITLNEEELRKLKELIDTEIDFLEQKE